ncbi:hypothetical protein [Paenibacillus pinistramenti]|uniref:hypothetical protein n=1 Tax=Paenibacillus pinistramenti TaxID=1768003 RepID=UPI001109A484|nr:hypothetical protein [Paenibacillus pinistramenti]
MNLVCSSILVEMRRLIGSDCRFGASTILSPKKVVIRMRASNKKRVLTSKEKALIMARVKAAKAARAKAAAKAKATAPKRRRVRQTLDRFIVLAVSPNGTNTPKDSAGWTARLIPQGGGTSITANFDDFGVVRFPNITTLTDVAYTLTIFDENNNALVSRSVPANREFYVARF